MFNLFGFGYWISPLRYSSSTLRVALYLRKTETGKMEKEKRKKKNRCGLLNNSGNKNTSPLVLHLLLFTNTYIIYRQEIMTYGNFLYVQRQ